MISDIGKAATVNTAGEEPGTTDSIGIIKYLAIDELKEFKEHPFKTYTGNALDKMVASIRERGVLVPVIVRPLKIGSPKSPVIVADRYEILSGHNRVNAAKIAELTTVPAEIRDVDDAQAVIIVNETNLQQRSFNDWLESEKAHSIAQYYGSIKSQGKQSESPIDASAEIQQKSDLYARKKTALIYSVKENIIEKYLQLNRLIEPLKNRLDNKDDSFGSIASKHISLLPEKAQRIVDSALNNGRYKLTVDKAKKIRDLSKTEEFTAESVEAILQEESNPAAKGYTVNSDIISKYFPDVKAEELEAKMIAAFQFYREHSKVMPHTSDAGIASDNR
jgi:ParB family chromosome partitioning protein